MSTAQSSPTRGVEVHHIDIVSESERHGRARDLFPVWFAANLNVGNAVFGALAVVVGNSVFWAILAVLVGNVIGGTFMALHSVQGARLGVPQLIQSRGQFGFFGALLPVVLAAFLYGGFFVVSAVIGGQALNAALPAVSVNQGIVLGAIVSVLLALLGYRAIHLAAKWAMWPLAAAVVVATIASIGRGGVSLNVGSFAPGPFLTAVGISITFLLTYAPYVSDYSRYLPSNTQPSSAFWATFGGVFLSTTWSEILGIFLAVQVTADTIFQSVDQVIGIRGLSVVVLLVTALAVAGNNALNLYGSMLNLLTGLSAFIRLRPSALIRVITLLPTLAIGLVLALHASADFYTEVNNFLSFLMLGFVPWGAINLLDYYLVRHGNYDVQAFFDPRGRYFTDRPAWTYFGINVAAFIAYVVGVLCAIPFMANAWYTGFVAAKWGNADMSWLPGLIVTGVVYLALVRIRDSRVGQARSTAAAGVTGS